MTKKLTKLTPEQESMLPVLRDEWLSFGLSTERTNQAAAIDAVNLAYIAGGLPIPKHIVFTDSPWSGMVLANLAKRGELELPGSQVRSQVGSQVRSQVYSQVDSQVGSQVDSQVYSQVDSQVGSQVDSQVRSQVDSQVGSQVRSQVDSQVRSQVDSQVRSQVGSQVGSQVRSQVYSQVRSQVYSQVRSQVYSQVYSQVDSQVYSQVDSQVYSQVDSQVYSQVDSQVYSQVDSQAAPARMEYVYPATWGNHSAWWMSYYGTFMQLGVEGLEPALGLIWLAMNAGWFWSFNDLAIVGDRPTVLERDDQHDLHNVTGPAVAYADGFSVYAVHGQPVPAHIIEKPDEITVAMVDAEDNAEVRRVMIELMGAEKYLAEATLLDEDADELGFPRKLWHRDVVDDEAFVAVELVNSTPNADGSRKTYFQRVPPETTTAMEAAAFLARKSVDSFRLVVQT